MLGRTQDAWKEAWKTVDRMKKEGCSTKASRKARKEKRTGLRSILLLMVETEPLSTTS